jgi:pyridoxamine 5'-phosphate oxidase
MRQFHFLDTSTVHSDPNEQFRRWYAAAADVPCPDGMVLSTVGQYGRPSSRVVLLKDFDARGFVFVTNYESRKGRELAHNPYAALLLFWPSLRRQVRIEGRIQRLSESESDSYFAARPRASNLSSMASPQSRVVKSRDWLERRVADLDGELAGQQLERPMHWGGYRLVADGFEFWQGGENRLHDRVGFRREPTGSEDNWVIERLAP